ncbi:MAG: hypothetical protein ABFD86_20695, partial [Bryobacteraceae bacterium]
MTRATKADLRQEIAELRHDQAKGANAMTRCLNLRAWQVRALQAGATQIRVPMREPVLDHERVIWDEHRSVWVVGGLRDSENAWRDLRCPYPPGTVIVGRETWQQVHPCVVDEGRCSIPGQAGIPGPPPVQYRVIYRADGEYRPVHFTQAFPYRESCPLNCTLEHNHPEERYTSWNASVHMPLWAARIRRTVTTARPQRVCEISEADARACGTGNADIAPPG